MKIYLIPTVVLLLLLVQIGFGQSNSEKINHDGLERSYVIHVPDVTDINAPMPLLIALHGAGSNGADFEKWTGFSQLADREGFVVAYPNTTNARGRQWNSMWNWGQEPDDAGFISALIDNLIKKYSIDPKKVFDDADQVGTYNRTWKGGHASHDGRRKTFEQRIPHHVRLHGRGSDE